MPTTPEACAACDRPMVRHYTQTSPGVVAHYGHGKCRNCYALKHRQGPPTKTMIRRYDTDEPDPVVIERALRGDRIPINNAELHQAITTLTTWGYSIRRTADHLGCSTRTINRHRAQLGLTLKLAA